MKKSWRVRDIEEFAECISDIEDSTKKAISNEPHLLTLTPLTDAKISAAQRKTYWMWLGEWEKFSGEIKDESHIQFKEKFLVRIFCHKEDQNEADFYARLVKKLRMLRDTSHPKYHGLKRRFLEEDVSIMDADKDEMSIYMSDIKNFLLSEFQFTVSEPSMRGLV